MKMSIQIPTLISFNKVVQSQINSRSRHYVNTFLFFSPHLGIEATDVTSLLEQFETQGKFYKCPQALMKINYVNTVCLLCVAH